MRRYARLRRRLRRSNLHLKLLVGVGRRRLLFQYHKRRKSLYLLFCTALLILLGYLLGIEIVGYKSALNAHAESLSSSGIIPQLAIAVGAAMLGVIGIVFSLSLFSIQQVAERGTSLTLREYANDWVLRIVYGSLAIFAVFALAVALLRKESAALAVLVNFIVLVATIFLLKLYFNRTIKFSDPHFIVSKIATRARRSLRTIKRMEHVIKQEVRYRRRKVRA